MIALYIVLGVLAAVLVFGVLPTLLLSYIIYSVVLVRTKPEKWNRGNTAPDDPEQIRIYDEAEAWAAENAACRRDVTVTNDGLRLVGEYYDFGCRRAVIIIPGRMEACRYSCHFAKSYKQAGFNVLTIDNRSHGLSEGKYNSLGFKEYRDILAWAALLHDSLGNDSVVLHGVCIGSSTALFACVSPDCPDYVRAMTADGMYETFCESFRLHMIQQKRPMFPYFWEIMLHIRVFAGADVVHDGPGKRIARMQKPILFLHGRKDQFSLPDKAQQLYDSCPSAEKQLIWFEEGAHSRLRLADPERYDEVVRTYYEKLFADRETESFTIVDK